MKITSGLRLTFFVTSSIGSRLSWTLWFMWWPTGNIALQFVCFTNGCGSSRTRKNTARNWNYPIERWVSWFDPQLGQVFLDSPAWTLALQILEKSNLNRFCFQTPWFVHAFILLFPPKTCWDIRYNLELLCSCHALHHQKSVNCQIPFISTILCDI